MKPVKARVSEEVGYTQVRFYPECTVCGWYPLHEESHIDAARVAGEHNAARHPDVPGRVETVRFDVHAKVKKKRGAS